MVNGRPIGLVDPFAGSCNGLCAIVRHLAGAKGIGFDVEPAVFDLTTQNIAHLNAPIERWVSSKNRSLSVALDVSPVMALTILASSAF